MRVAKRPGLTAGDIMSRSLITVPLDMTLGGLALILHENGITGAPVVDREGELVGVVSQSDLVRYGSHPGSQPHIVPLDLRSPTDADEDGEEIASPYYTHLDRDRKSTRLNSSH